MESAIASGDVLGDGGLHRQIAVGEARQLVEQAQDRLLVALVLLGLLLGRLAEVASAVVDEHHQSRDRQRREHEQQRQARREAALDDGGDRASVSR